MFELDHTFILNAPGAPVADELAALGLTEGSPNRHPGMGTANRRFFFSNAMIELLYVRDETETRSEPIAPTWLWERSIWRESGASPYAIVLRPTVEDAALPFATWDWKPPFLPAGASIKVASGTAMTEPLIFFARGGPRPHPFAPDKPEPIEHPLGVQRISGLKVTLVQAGEPSEPLRQLERLGLARFTRGAEPLLEIELDGAARGQSKDLRPAIPVVLRW